jgi:hypothetical protein
MVVLQDVRGLAGGPERDVITGTAAAARCALSALGTAPIQRPRR